MKNTKIFCLLAIMVLLIGCSSKKEVMPEPTPVEPEVPVVMPEPTPVEPVLPVAEVPTQYVGEGVELITQAACSNGKISARLTNTAETPVKIGHDVIIFLRGMVVRDPGCEAMELAPGASTVCTQLNGPFPIVEGENQVVVRIGRVDVRASINC